MWLRWHALFMTSEKASHGEVEAANKYVHIFFPKPELSKKVIRAQKSLGVAGLKVPAPS